MTAHACLHKVYWLEYFRSDHTYIILPFTLHRRGVQSMHCPTFFSLSFPLSLIIKSWLSEWMKGSLLIQIFRSALCCAKNTKCMSDHVLWDLWEDLFFPFPYNISKAANRYRNMDGKITHTSTGEQQKSLCPLLKSHKTMMQIEITVQVFISKSWWEGQDCFK